MFWLFVISRSQHGVTGTPSVSDQTWYLLQSHAFVGMPYMHATLMNGFRSVWGLEPTVLEKRMNFSCPHCSTHVAVMSIMQLYMQNAFIEFNSALCEVIFFYTHYFFQILFTNVLKKQYFSKELLAVIFLSPSLRRALSL